MSVIYHETTGDCVVCKKIAMYRTDKGECEDCAGKAINHQELSARFLALTPLSDDEFEVANGILYWYAALKLSPAVEQFLYDNDLRQVVSEVARRWDGERYLNGVKDTLLAYYKEIINERDDEG